MIKEGLGFFNLTQIPILGLLIFLGVFIGATLWAFRKSGISHYKYMESLPLSEEGAVKKGANYEQ